MKTRMWQGVFGEVPCGKLILYDPQGQAGLWPFVLPKSHWITNAACCHDGWYSAAARGGIERTDENRARADFEFLQIARIDAEHICKHGGTEIVSRHELAEMMEVAARCYLIVRGPIGKIAWET